MTSFVQEELPCEASCPSDRRFVGRSVIIFYIGMEVTFPCSYLLWEYLIHKCVISAPKNIACLCKVCLKKTDLCQSPFYFHHAHRKWSRSTLSRCTCRHMTRIMKVRKKYYICEPCYG